jgi:phage terminase large subunit
VNAEELAKLFGHYRKHPEDFVRQMLKAEPYPHQTEIMQAVARGDRKVSVRSGRRVGKTTSMAWLSMWFEMTRPDAKTVVTAPSSAQLADAYVPEFRKWVQRLPEELAAFWDLKQERFDFRLSTRQGFESFVSIRTARKDAPESLQGINATNVLVLVDEAAGVDDIVMESLSGSMGGDGSFMVLTGNPNRNVGFFYDTHTRLADRWTTLHVSSADVPSVSRDWIEEMQDKYGVHSNAFRIHVLGEFPLADDDTVIPRELIQSAVARDVVVMESQPIVWGLDVARFGDDQSCLVVRQGNFLHSIKSWRNLDTQQLASRVKTEWDLLESDKRPEIILVDVVGLGAGVVDRLREWDLPVRGVHVSENPALREQYKSLKDELWDRARVWFERRDCRIPNDEELVEQLAMVRKDFGPTGKMRVESKKELKRRGESSPDKADALVLTFASHAAVAIHGRVRQSAPLRRNIRGIV